MSYSVKYISCVKIVLISFNLILFLFGWAVMGIGIWLRVDPRSYEPSRYIETENYVAAAWIMIFTGFVIIVIGFLGCYGTVHEKPGIICTYFILMSIAAVFELTALILAVTHGFGDRLEDYLTQQILLQIQQRPYHDKSRRFLDFLQVRFHCCGAKNFNDYQKYGMEIPVSCGGERVNFLNQEGCGRAMRNIWDVRGGVIVALTGGATLIQMICIISSISLYCAVKHADVD